MFFQKPQCHCIELTTEVIAWKWYCPWCTERNSPVSIFLHWSNTNSYLYTKILGCQSHFIQSFCHTALLETSSAKLYVLNERWPNWFKPGLDLCASEIVRNWPRALSIGRQNLHRHSFVGSPGSRNISSRSIKSLFILKPQNIFCARCLPSCL